MRFSKAFRDNWPARSAGSYFVFSRLPCGKDSDPAFGDQKADFVIINSLSIWKLIQSPRAFRRPDSFGSGRLLVVHHTNKQRNNITPARHPKQETKGKIGKQLLAIPGKSWQWQILAAPGNS